MNNQELINMAITAMNGAYTPYSKYKVGAALVTSSGVVYTGCNIENASYSATNCAERTAFFKAVSEGERGFSKIAVVGGLNGEITDYASPCGICRQVMREFCDDDFEIIIAKSTEDYKVYTLSQLLPSSFSQDNLGG